MNNSYAAQKKLTQHCVCTVLLFASFIGGSAQAASTLNLSVKGQIQVTLSCAINGGNPIDVDFGSDLLTNYVDGVRYAKDIPFTMTCTGTPATLDLWVRGDSSIFDSEVLKTDMTDLGVRFLKGDGSQLNLGDKIRFTDPAAPPTLRAAPIKRAGSSPSGRFNGIATLMVDVA